MQKVANGVLGSFPVHSTHTVDGVIQHVMLVDVTGTYVDASGGGGGGGDGAINDGVSSSIKATVLDLTSSNPLTTALVDANGDQITSFGGGTQYTEGDTDASITGTAMLMEVAANTLQPVQGTVADGLLVNLGANNDVTVTGSVTANAGTNLNTSALALESGGNLATIAGKDFATQTTLAQIKAKTDNIPPLGQALAAASTPVVLTAAQLTTLTPPAAITNYAQETGGNLATIAGKDFATQTTLALIKAKTDNLDVASSTRLSETDFDTKIGSLTEAAPGTDTDSSGLNGRLQRIAQRITSLIALLPIALTASGNFKVAVQEALPAGANAIGKLAANSGVTIGAVEIAAAQTLANVTTLGTITNNVNTVEVAPTTLLNGKTIVTTAGSRVALAPSTTCKSVTIKALATNTGTIYVGNSSVSSANGYQLAAGDTVSLDISNLNTVNLDASVSGEGVTYLGVN